jgi:hypothetical protein
MSSTPNPPLSLDFINSLDLHPKLKILLYHSLEGSRPPAELFDDASYSYYMDYVRPKLSRALAGGGSQLYIYVSPNYLIYEVVLYYRRFRTTHRYRYLAGVDGDRVFINRVAGAPDYYLRAGVFGNVELRLISDRLVHGVLGYMIDMGGVEDVVIDITPNPVTPVTPATRIRVQGDLALEVAEPSEAAIRDLVGPRRVEGHVAILLADLVNRVLLDRGLSPQIRGADILLPSAAPRKNSLAYLERLARLLHRGLSELLGDGEVELRRVGVGEDVYDDYIYEVRVMGGYKCSVLCGVEFGGLGNPYDHLAATVDCNPFRLGPGAVFHEVFREALEALEGIPFVTHELSVGNHYARIANAKPLSFTFRPSKQPLTLNENIITVANPLIYIVTPSTTIELHHREHGMKTIRFKRNYIIRFTHIDTHPHYLIERNRAILRNIEP